MRGKGAKGDGLRYVEKNKKTCVRIQKVKKQGFIRFALTYVDVHIDVPVVF